MKRSAIECGLVSGLALLMAVLASCTSGRDISSDFDHAANFSAYKTFGYATPLGTEVDGYSTLITQSLKTATRRELETRGYRYADADPDLLVNFSARFVNLGRVDASTEQHVGYYGYRRIAVYKPWPSYAYEGNDYTEGTLNIDLVDAKRKQLVWEGVAVGRVKDEKLTNPQPAIDDVVGEIFAKYTYRAAK
jgi:hypothetical protein